MSYFGSLGLLTSHLLWPIVRNQRSPYASNRRLRAELIPEKKRHLIEKKIRPIL
jgi:hypothetical protein